MSKTLCQLLCMLMPLLSFVPGALDLFLISYGLAWMTIIVCSLEAPMGCGRQLCDALGVREDPEKILWDEEGNHVNITSDDMKKIGSFWKRALSRRLLRIAQRKHPNLLGVVCADMCASLKLLKGPAKFPRAELIQILTDGIWTQKIRAKMQEQGDSLCRLCRSEEETPAHIFLRCPHWAPHRKWSPMVQNGMERELCCLSELPFRGPWCHSTTPNRVESGASLLFPHP